MKLTEYSELFVCVEEMKKLMELYLKIKDTEVFNQFYEEDVVKRVKLEKQQI